MGFDLLKGPYLKPHRETFLFEEPMQLHNASHSCDFELVDWMVPLSIPSLNAIPKSGFPTGITITGKDIQLDKFVMLPACMR